MGTGYWKHLIVVSSVCLAVSPVRAQDDAGFDVDAVSVRTADGPGTRLDLYAQVPYGRLSFISTPDGFQANYEVLAEFYALDERSRPGTMVESSIWERTARVGSFSLTQSDDQFDHSTHSLDLKPARYLASVQVTDNNSEQTYLREFPVEVRDLTAPVVLSDIVLLKEFDAETNTIYPHVSDELEANLLTFQIFYEIYADDPQRVQVLREVVPIRKDPSALRRMGRTLLGLREDTTAPAVLFSDAETSMLARGRHQTVSRIPLNEFDMGDYLVRVTLLGDDGAVLDVSERTFTARWTGLASHLVDLDQAIDQLVYCAKNRDVRAIRSAPSQAERLARFEDFWRKRDPTPRTGRNERMEEYYYRIDLANRKFGSFMPGWKTDRGHVLILHGYPDDVKRQTFSFDAQPWEIWYYYRIGRQFIFIDKTGFGDFELIVPIWDERTRIR